jgi:hypothetical protein
LAVLVAYLVLLGFLGAAAFGYVPTLVSPTASTTDVPVQESVVAEWSRYVRPVLVWALFVATAGLFIRWMNAWFHEHAKAEFQLIKYADDFERANWLAELATEWKNDNGEPVPVHVIDRLGKNLFEDEHSEQVATTTGDAVLSAFKRGRVKFGDIELQIGKQEEPKASGDKK